MNSAPPARYAAVSIALHWMIGAALLAQIGFGFLLDTIAPRGTPDRSVTINLHKSFGIVLLMLIAARLLWRLRHPPPPLPSTLPAWQRRGAVAGHRALYVCMLTMPMSGAIASNFSKHGIRFFGNHFPPLGPDLPAVYAVFNYLHIGTAWLFAALIAGHVAMALKHAWIDRDGIFERMWPVRSR